MAFSLSPSVDVREFDLTLSIPNLPSSKTGSVIRADWGEALAIKSITNERDQVNNFLEPTSYNYQDWFNNWNFLQYSSSLYSARAMDKSAENAGIEITGDAGFMSAAQLTQAKMYNADVAELSLDQDITPQGIQFYNRYVTSQQPWAVAVCDNATSWELPFCSENIRRFTSDGTVDTTLDTTESVLASDWNTMVVGDAFIYDGTSYAVDAVDGTSITVSPALVDSTGDPVVGVILNLATAIDTAANAIFSDDLVNVDGSLPAFKAFFEYAPDWDNNEFAVIVFKKNSAGLYETHEDEQYVVHKVEGGRDSEGRNIFVNEMFFKQSNALYAKYNVDYTGSLDTAYSPLPKIVGTAVDSSGSEPLWLYPRTWLTDHWAYDPVGYKLADVINAFDLFADPESFDINILITHELELAAGAQDVAGNIAMSRKDCFNIVAPYDYASIVGKTPTEATQWMIESFAGAQYHTPGDLQFNAFSSYTAMYANMKYQYDKFNDVNRWMCIAGDIAGLAAQTDANRDPWWAIAGLERGKIKNVIKPAFNPNKQNRDDLYVNALNPVMSVPGEGVMVVWGQKTALAKPSAFDRLNVRRLLITLQKAIATAARYAIFEFNDEFTRARLRGLIEPFLRDVKGRRGLYDFEVVIDESNNTAEVIDKNALIIDVYLKPTKVAEFIQVNMKVTRTDANFEELIGR